jgi:hypothetical protein
MANSVQIIDNFYVNVDDVRSNALKQEFGVKGNYPGHRTVPFINDSIRNEIERHLTPVHGKIIWPKGEDTYCGSYQYTTSKDRTWIHADSWNSWAGVLYLTPNAPLSGGTGLFKHKETGLVKVPRLKNGKINKKLLDKIYIDSQDYTKWEITDRIANVYNRLVLYRGDLFHASLDYFGTNKNNGRLFQTFFFNTEL